MNVKFGFVAPTLFVLLAAGCGSVYPVPAQRLADAQAASRSAQELGAAQEPTAQLYLKLAEEQTAMANKAMKNGDNKRADYLLIRAKADAELAIALAREEQAKAELQQATGQSTHQAKTNAVEGAQR